MAEQFRKSGLVLIVADQAHVSCPVCYRGQSDSHYLFGFLTDFITRTIVLASRIPA